MFELEYCDNPDNGEIHSSGIKFDYRYDVEFDSKLKALDKFLFLVDMYTIIDSCAKDLLEARDWATEGFSASTSFIAVPPYKKNKQPYTVAHDCYVLLL